MRNLFGHQAPTARTFVVYRPFRHWGVLVQTIADECGCVTVRMVGQYDEIIGITQGIARPIPGETIQ
jgi:hypothetical protein